MIEPRSEYLDVDPHSCRHEWWQGTRGRYSWLQSKQFSFVDFFSSWKLSPDLGQVLTLLQTGYEGTDDYFQDEHHWKKLSNDYCLSPALTDLDVLNSALEGDNFLIFPANKDTRALADSLENAASGIDLFQRTNVILGTVEDPAIDNFWKSLEFLDPIVYVASEFMFTLITPDESIIHAIIDSTAFTGIEERLLKQATEAKRKSWAALGPECGPETCVEPGCDRLRIQRAIRCFKHQLGSWGPRRETLTHRPPIDVPSAVHKRVFATSVPERVRANGAVVLERLAAGAGTTNWYYCPDERCLEYIENRLRPGSLVSFYFDNRIQRVKYSDEVKADAKQLISKTRFGIIIGYLDADGIEIHMAVDVGADELEEYESELMSSVLVFYGEYPADDNDGINAVTLILPDADGIVRCHPH